MASSTAFRIEPLRRDNYDSWSIQAQALLIKNDLWEYVSGEIRKPTDSTEAAAWNSSDRKAKSELILIIHPLEIRQIKDCVTSNEVWKKLKGVYQSKNPVRKAMLLKQLTLSRLQAGEDVKDHLDNFFDTVSKLKELDIDIHKDLLSILLLCSLPDDYNNFRCAMECRDELPDAEILRVKILEEDQVKLKNETKNSAMLVSKKDFKYTAYSKE